MGNLNLDDALGFFRELVDPNFREFYWDYQSDEECGRDKLIGVFRKMVNLCLTLNHQADKLTHKLQYKCAHELIDEVAKHYPPEGAALNAVREFSNDIKHKSKLDQNYTTRKRRSDDQPQTGSDLPEWYFVSKRGERIAVCTATVDAYLFWGKWFAGERELLRKNT